MVDIVQKICSMCKEHKALDNFANSKNGTHGKSAYCKPCNKIYHVEYDNKKLKEDAQYKNKRNNRIRANRLKVLYGITEDKYNHMFLLQNGNCAICKRNRSEFDKELAVDHCHTTGKIRGLLCSNCNTALGLLKDSEELILDLLKYLKEHKK